MKRNRRRRLGGGANEEEERKGRPSPSAAPVARRRCSTTVAVSNAARAFACVVVECCCCRCPALGFSFWARWAPNLNRAPRFYFLFLFFFSGQAIKWPIFFLAGGVVGEPRGDRRRTERTCLSVYFFSWITDSVDFLFSSIDVSDKVD